MHGLRGELHTEVANLKSTLLMWLVPTIIGSITGSVGLAVALTRGV